MYTELPYVTVYSLDYGFMLTAATFCIDILTAFMLVMPASPHVRTWCHWIKSWNWFCVQIIMFTGMQRNFDVRFTHFPNPASPETSTIDKILTLNHPSIRVHRNYFPITTQDLLHCTILNNLHSCQHEHKNVKKNTFIVYSKGRQDNLQRSCSCGM